MATREESTGRGLLGAYGLRLTGLPDAGHLLVRASQAWPELRISARRGSIEGAVDRVDDERATLVLVGATAEVERLPGSVAFTFEDEPDTEAIVHPYLAPVAGLLSHWHGRDCIHAGAFAASDGAWGVLGERGGGKSSTLARLALDGVPIVTDDVLVLDGETAFVGPRAVDLREEPARALGAGEPLGVLGRRERWRLRLDDTAPTWPLRGWVFLAWGDEVAVTPVSAGERLQRLATERVLRLPPPDPRTLVSLASLPAFELRRPRHWSSLEAATSLLLESLP
jgi:hypothetical protein